MSSHILEVSPVDTAASEGAEHEDGDGGRRGIGGGETAQTESTNS